MQHVARGTTNSPCVSLTRSYGVAKWYAITASRNPPTSGNPAHVYEIEFDPLPPGLQLIDPVMAVTDAFRSASWPPGSAPYYHDGAPEFLVGVAGYTLFPRLAGRILKTPYPQPPPGGGTSRPPNLTIELETFVRVLRDAEILVAGTIPTSCIRNDIDIF